MLEGGEDNDQNSWRNTACSTGKAWQLRLCMRLLLWDSVRNQHAIQRILQNELEEYGIL